MDETYQAYAKVVYRYLMSLTHDADLAEELTQETFYQAIRSSDRFDGSCKVSTWLCGIARNVLLTHRRRHPQTAELQEQDQVANSAEADVISAYDRMELLRQVHRLDDPYREVVYLRIFGNLSFRDVGEVFGKTENWARTTFYRAKVQLRKAGDQHDHAEL